MTKRGTERSGTFVDVGLALIAPLPRMPSYDPHAELTHHVGCV